MHTSHSTGENRLLGYLLEDINKQRLAAGATKTVTPYNSRTAEANVAMQNMPTGSTGTAITDPASASLQRLRQTQEYLTQNPTVDPTGSINTQALAGQKLAESYVAPRNLGNEQYYKDQANFLQGATATYSNQANGFASSVTNKIDTDPNSPTYGQQISGDVQTASMSAIQQSAIDRLRREGKTDEQITTIMNDPVYMENIRTTMSNTGQGGTARQSAVLTPAQAQTILATSRNALERSKAQQFLDAEAEKGISRTVQVQVGVDKTGQPIYQTRTNPNFEKELEAKKQRMTQEQTNALKVQESMSKMKDFTSGIDTSAFEMTKNQINEAMGMIKNLSPDLQSAVLPALLSLQESNNRINETALQMKSTLPTDKEIESEYGSFEAYITKMDEKMTKMNEENKQLQLDVATYNRDALEIDKQIIEHDAYVAEQKQMQANVENEKRLRRQLGKLGINTDVQGLNFLQSEIQKGADAYNDLKKGNNLVSLKAQLAIGQGYALDVRKAISDYDAQNLQITSQTAEALMKVKQSISTAKSDRDKELRSILEKSLEKKDANDKEARKTVFDANMKMIDEVGKMRDDDRTSQNDAYKNVIDSFTNFPAGSKERQTAIDAYKKSGGTISFNANTKTIEEINEASDNASGNFVSDNVGKYRDATTGDDLAIVISSVISGKGIATADERTGRRNDLMALLQGGEATREEFNQLLMNTAYIALDTDERKQVDAKTQVSEAIARVKENIDNLTPAQKAKMGFWAKKLRGVASMADVANDPEFIRMMGDITYPMASLRKELFGSALTLSELGFSDVFLANPMKEDISDSVQKLMGIKDNLENDISSLYSHRLGSKEFYDVLKKDGVIPTSSPEIKDWNKTIQESLDGTTGSGGLLEPLADAHIKHEGYGTQGAKTITENNNPGALRWSPAQETFGGVKPGGTKPDGTKNEGGFTWFPDYDSGRKALIADLNAKISGKSRHIDYSKNPTLFDYISVYAPVGDRNNPSAYAKAIVSDLVASGYNVDINTPLSELKKLIV